MRIILTGATGFVGSAVLTHAISNPQISHIIVLTRRPLDPALPSHIKVTQIIHSDFTRYSVEVLSQLRWTDACIWAVGGKAEDFPDFQTARVAGVETTLAAAAALSQQLQLVSAPDSFKFVYCSGRGAEWDQKRQLWISDATRKLKGEVERGLFEVAKNHKGFEVIVLRPGGVLTRQQTKWQFMIRLMVACISVEQLAEALVLACIRETQEGDVKESMSILENEDILRVLQTTKR